MMEDVRGNPYPADYRPPYGAPESHGLYDPASERENCGVGFVAHIKGERSHSILVDAERILRHMDHRGACGCESNTGDGAGMLTALPHEFLKRVAREDIGVDLPAPGKFGAGIVFLPQDEAQRANCRQTVEQLIAEQGQKLLGWRTLPVDFDGADIGRTARAFAPHMEMLFVGSAEGLDQEQLERQLFVIRKRASHQLRSRNDSQALSFYVCSLSTKVIIYKGMLTSLQVIPSFKDLQAEDYTSHLAMVHSRFATNTFPSWDRAQPLRFSVSQRRNQYRQGQQQLDVRAAGRHEKRLVGRRPAKAVSDC
ncbi:MAG: hypothetical protein R3C19_01870 [Planctomycetaceae bacterium]